MSKCNDYRWFAPLRVRFKDIAGANTGSRTSPNVFGQDVEEYVSVIGTPAFMEFVGSIKAEGVELKRKWIVPARRLRRQLLKLIIRI